MVACRRVLPRTFSKHFSIQLRTLGFTGCAVPQAVYQECDHAPGAGRFFLVRHAAEVGDGVQEIFSADACANRSRCDRGIQQRLHGREHACVEETRQGAVGGVARSKRSCKPSLGGDEVHVALHPASQGLTRFVLRGEFGGCIGARVDLALKDCLDKIRTLREVAIHRSQSNSRPLRDLPDRRVHTRSLEDLHSRIEKAPQLALRIGSHTARRCFGMFLFLRNL